MQISILRRKRANANKQPPSTSYINSRGFTLIEILTSLLLISITFGLVATGVSTSRDNVESTEKEIERAIAYSIDEATIRNSIIRIHFVFDSERQKILVEGGEEGNFMLPKFLFNQEQTSELSKEELAAKKKNLANNFHPLKEFQDPVFELEEDVRIIGVASSISQQLVTEGDAAIYFYPTGEKDDALVIIGSDEEIVAIKLAAYQLKVTADYMPIKVQNGESISDRQIEMAKEVFEQWLKK